MSKSKAARRKNKLAKFREPTLAGKVLVVLLITAALLLITTMALFIP